MSTTVFFADDHKLFRQTLIPALKSHDIITTAEAGNGAELLELLKENKPDLILLDLEMPVMNGSQALRKVKWLYPDLKVIIISTHYHEALISHLYSAGANAFVSKDSSLELVVNTIRLVHENKLNMAANITGCDDENEQEKEKLRFSKREFEITSLICEGRSNKEIADKLNITNKTVEAHKKKLFNKTKTQSALDFVTFVFKKGINFLL